MRVSRLMPAVSLRDTLASRFATVRTTGRVVATLVNVGAVFAVGGLVALLDTLDVVLAKPRERRDEDVAQESGA